MKANQVMNKYGICRETLCRWVKTGKIKYEVLPSGQYNYIIKTDPKVEQRKKSVIYARCSTTGQKDNLARQIDRLRAFASSNGYTVDTVYSEIASALNYNRKEYRKLYSSIINGEVNRVIVEYKDRILRIGFDDFRELCRLCGVELIVVDDSYDNDKTTHGE